jgi:predicted lipoprotein with Yx(FWY)xxD motif
LARGNPTKVHWDWSTAGQDKARGQRRQGHAHLHKKKGSFKWAESAKPEYRWYNGTVRGTSWAIA